MFLVELCENRRLPSFGTIHDRQKAKYYILISFRDGGLGRKMGETTSKPVENKYPWSNYTLKMGRGGPVSTTQYVLYAVQIAAVIILSYLSVVLLGPLSYSGISLFYFVYPFFLVFTMWWGIWGVLGAYIGCVLGAGLFVGLGVVPSILYSISDFVPPFFAFIVYRGLLANRGYDPLWRDLTDKEVAGVKTKRVGAWVLFVLINGVILNAVSAELGVGIQLWLQTVPPEAFTPFWLGWFFGDLVAMVVITPFLVKGLTALVERQGLINHGWVT
jgi:integral membrane sensor domain MASE1